MGIQALINRTESPDFGATIARQAAAQASRGLDAGEAHADLLEQVSAELKAGMTRALHGQQAFVPSWQIVGLGKSTAEKLSSAAEEVLVALDNVECCESLMAALAHSECPHVARLRGLLIARYVADNAEEIANVRGAA